MTNDWTVKAVKLDYIGHQQVQVIDPAGPRLIWQCELPDTADGDLALLAALDAKRFVAVHEFGKSFIGQVDKRELTLFSDIDCGADMAAWLDAAKGHLWLAAEDILDGDRDKQLLCADLNAGELIHEFDFPDFALDQQSLQPLADGCFAFYGRNDKAGIKFRKHWLGVVDTRNGQWQQHTLASTPTPQSLSIRRQRFFDRNRALTIVPGANGLTAQEGGFEYALSCINLAAAKEAWQQPVRWLPPELMADELGDTGALSRIAAGQISHSDNDEWMRFLTCLTAIGFCQNEAAMWLGWQDGALQKLSLGGERLSPLYALHEEGRQQQRLERQCSAAISHIEVQANGSLVLGVGEHDDFSFWQLEAPQSDSVAGGLMAAERQRRWLQASPYLPPAVTIANAIAMPGVSGCVPVSVSDLESEHGQLAALTQVKGLMPALAAYFSAKAKTGFLGKLRAKKKPATQALYFAYSDSLGRALSDYQFLAMAQHAQGGQALMADIIGAFSQWPLAGDIVGPKGEPAFAEMAFYLSEQCIEHLPVLANYFIAIGGGEDVHPYHINRTIAYIHKHYAGTKELAAFNSAVPWPYHDASFAKPEADEYDDWGYA
ncbi:hypothetical protein [Gallaecimonas mangrovi]|uniref:hypothetical protein n=1 Tax=Gallaecimonas mangrovi TaxID=2291597 RepID=UPI000E207390|nr:hypothetical protein [Gallaecimonas mangrovi]